MKSKTTTSQVFNDTPTQKKSLLDAAVPAISTEVLHPTPARRMTSSLMETSAKVAKKAKRMWNDFYDWLISYVPEPVRVNPASAIEKLKERVKGLYKRTHDFKSIEKANGAKGYFKTFTIEGRDDFDPLSFLGAVRPTVVRLIENNLNKGLKVKLVLQCDMEKINPATGDAITASPHFRSKLKVIIQKDTIPNTYSEISDEILENIASYQREGSGWRFKSVNSLDIHFNRFEPLSGSSYIPLPKVLENKKAIINVQNLKDNECFKWAITSAIYPAESSGKRVTKYIENSKKFNWEGISFPTSLREIDTFEKQNPSISVNVFGYEKEVYPLRISKRADAKTVNLILISNEENHHYCYIKNMSRLLSSQISNSKCKRFFCLRCLNSFPTEESLQKHDAYCSNNEAVRVQLPDAENSLLSFKAHNKSMQVPFVVYADFESFTERLEGPITDPSNSYTHKYQKHSPSGFCYYICCSLDKSFNKLVKYTKKERNEDVSKVFIERLEEDIKRIYNEFKFPKKMIFKKQDKKNFESATDCHICDKPLGSDRVRDHCHITGKYRGAAHNKCNLNFKIPKFYPVLFHNLSGYDAHLFIKNLGQSSGNIKCIPNNEEKYISFSKDIVVDTFTPKGENEKVEVKREIRFIDSFRFMSSSLNSLAENLDEYPILSTHYSGKLLELVSRKGVFPYDYFSDFDRLNDTELPSIEKFYSVLNGEGISEEEYRHAQKVWRTFNMQTFREYHDLYLETDVLLLADVFENFRSVCLKNYKLDPAHYYTSPGLAWDAALKVTGIELELLTDPDMLLFFEQSIRGGISTITHRYAKANNKYMGDDYDPSQPSKYIQYLDANNLYGWAMSKPLPTGGFKWMKNLNNWRNRPCVLEVDLDYPENLHSLHNDYPLAPETLKVGNVNKLIPNLMNKEKYILHRDNLILYESLGLKIKKIHRGITFSESPWLKRYIDLNTELRTKATNAFEKDFFKLMNNSVFGKTMENIRRRMEIRLISNENEAKKLISKPNFEHRTIFSDNLIAVHMKKTKMYYNKPIYLGMCILDISKTLMYDFHYNYIIKRYGENAKLLFTDTDSLAYEIQTDDFYQDIKPDIDRLFDTSNYTEDHQSGIQVGVNKKRPGYFKDEVGGGQILEFAGLRSKLYAYKLKDIEEKKCKGVKKAIVKKHIGFEDYKRCLFDRKEIYRKMNVIRSYKHELYTEEVNKIALSSEDDKRIISEDGIHTLAHGHYKVRRDAV